MYFTKCTGYQQTLIFAGWYDAYKIMDANKNGLPDWNEAAALEFLGPNGIKNAQQAQISCESRFNDLS